MFFIFQNSPSTLLTHLPLTPPLLICFNPTSQRYYAEKKKKKLAAQVNSGAHTDKKGDYVIRPHEKLNNRYIVENVIGKGSFGRVVKAYDELRDEYVAIKIVKSKRAFRKQALIELKILQTLQSADPNDEFNIVRMKDEFLHHNHQCIVFELLSMNLYQLLRDTRYYGVSLNLVRKFARQLLTNLEFLRTVKGGVIHCDLKPENVLLRNSKHSKIKVIDFGSACFSDDKMYTYIQSRFYRAPEVLLGCPYSTAIDMWSLGCILVEMHTGKPIFDGQNAHEQVFLQALIMGVPPLHMITSGTKAGDYFAFMPESNQWRLRRGQLDLGRLYGRKKTLRQVIGVDTNGPSGRRANEAMGHTHRDYKNFHDLVIRMLDYNPKTRITPGEALKHKFFQESIDRSTQVEGPVSAVPLYYSAVLGQGTDDTSWGNMNMGSDNTPNWPRSAPSTLEGPLPPSFTASISTQNETYSSSGSMTVSPGQVSTNSTSMGSNTMNDMGSGEPMITQDTFTPGYHTTAAYTMHAHVSTAEASTADAMDVEVDNLNGVDGTLDMRKVNNAIPSASTSSSGAASSTVSNNSTRMEMSPT